MRRVMVLGWSDDEANPVKVDRGEATFHGFTTDSCIDEGHPVTFPAAIVEWPNGEVTSIYVDFIRFLDSPS